MELFLQRLVDGLGNGAIYGALALGVVLVWRSTRTVNLAQGTMGMFCAFVAWKLQAPDGLGWPLLLAVLVAIVLGGVMGAVIERVAIRPLENEESHLPVIVVTLGLGMGLSAITGKVFTLDSVAMPSLFPNGGATIAGVRLGYTSLGLIAVILVVAALMWVLFTRTTIGLFMRAAVDNPESAQLVGIQRSRMMMLGWGLAGALGALAACLIAPVTSVQTGMLEGALLYAFAAAILGGFDSAVGAVTGGMLIGVFQTMVASYVGFIGNELSLTAVLVLIVATLIVKPAGLFGQKEVSRV